VHGLETEIRKEGFTIVLVLVNALDDEVGISFGREVVLR